MGKTRTDLHGSTRGSAGWRRSVGSTSPRRHSAALFDFGFSPPQPWPEKQRGAVAGAARFGNGSGRYLRRMVPPA